MKVNKTALWLALILTIALVLRFIVAYNSLVLTDETVFAVRAINFLSSGMYSTIDQVPLHLAFVDLAEKIFGVSGWSARMPNIIFGALSILAIYLLAQELGRSKSESLLASFLFAVSGYAVLFNIETDMTSIFFLLLSILFYFKAFKKDTEIDQFKRYFLLCFLFLGIAALAKLIALFILPAYLVGILWYARKKEHIHLIKWSSGSIQFPRQGIKTLLLAVLIFVLAISPILIYNFILYQEKGAVDLIFARSLGMKTYDSFFGNDIKSWSFGSNLNIIKVVFLKFAAVDAPLLFLFIIGLIYVLAKRNMEYIILLIGLLSTLFLLSGTSGSSKSHYLFLIPIMALVASYGFTFLKEKMSLKKMYPLAIVIILIYTSIILYQNQIFAPDGGNQVREQVKTFEKNGLVIADSRIYNGNIAWMFHDTHYLESKYFPDIGNLIKESTAPVITVPIYFIECVNDDCGWGKGIKDNAQIQELNEAIVSLFKSNAKSITQIPGKQYSYTVYKTEGQITTQILDAVDKTHQFYFYSVGWEDPAQNFDHFALTSTPLKILNWIGRLVFYTLIIGAFYGLYLLYKLIMRNVLEH